MSHGLTTDTTITREQLLERRALPVHVIGAASAEGVAVMRTLLALGFVDVIAHDMRPRAELRRAFRTTHGAYSRVEQDDIFAEITPLLDAGRCADEYCTGIDPASTVVLGQGWYLDPRNREIVRAACADVELITSMTQLYLACAPGPVAGITGTNGKSTTTAIAEHLLRTGGVEVNVAGNERSSQQFLPRITGIAQGTWSLLEISNRQLMQVQRSPQVAAITALTPDHLEEHGGLDGYVATKRRMFEFQQPGDIAIACADDAAALGVASASAGTVVRCGIGVHDAPSVTWGDGELVATGIPVHAAAGGGTFSGVVAHALDVQMPGEHNLRNVAVAAAVAISCGVPAASIGSALRDFAGKSLRLEQIADLDGVTIWSDIKSTTPESTCAALEALRESGHVYIVLGGDDKGLDYSPLAARIASPRITALAVPGTATDALAAALAAIDPASHLERVDRLDDALDSVLARARAGDAVIVSPAAAGFWTTQLQGGASLRSLIRRRQQQMNTAPEVTPR